jgi:hypothetical protein
MLQKLKDSWWIFSGILIPVSGFLLKFYIDFHDMKHALNGLKSDQKEAVDRVVKLESAQATLDSKLPLIRYQLNTISTKLNVLIPPEEPPPQK